MLTVETQFITS